MPFQYGGGGGTAGAGTVYTAPVSGGFSASPPASSAALGHGTSITVPGSLTARKFAVWGFIVADGNNYSAQVLLDGSTSIANSAGAPAVDANGFSQAVCIGLTTIPGDGNTHTLALAWQSVSNTNSRSVNAATCLVAVG